MKEQDQLSPWQEQRRAFLKMGLALGVSLFLPGCTIFREKVDPLDSDLFPENQWIDQDFLNNREKIDRIREVSRSFPLITTKIPADMKMPEILISSEEQTHQAFKKFKADALAFIAIGGYVGILLNFDEDVYFGKEFQKDQTPWPAFIVAMNRNIVEPTKYYSYLGYSENSRITEKLGGFYTTFHVRIEEIVNEEFVVFFNRNLFSTSPNRGSIIPIRMKVEIQNHQSPTAPLPSSDGSLT